MSLRWRLLLLMLVVYCVGGYFLTRRALDQVRPRYLESMEETLVDTSVLLASVIETQLVNGRLDPDGLQRALGAAQGRHFAAKVFSLQKTTLEMRVYVTDAAGRVVFDSSGADVGQDYSRWNDVQRTLRGQYGARSSRTTPGDDNTQTIYVSAPLRHEDRIVGVLSVGKSTRGINALVAVAKQRLAYGAMVGGLIVLLLLLLVVSWVIAPLERLTTYARAVRDGRPATLPALPGRTLRELGIAFEEMRDALEGTQHVERYTQVLAHEVKAPLAAIRGAAELLEEPMPPEQREKFLGNIKGETARIHQIVERLLELSSLEARKALRQTEQLTSVELVAEAVAAMESAFSAKSAKLLVDESGTSFHVRGERVLLREALVNLLQNALDFSDVGQAVTIGAGAAGERGVFTVRDNGTGIPDYALPRIFERFYSLHRPGTTRKSTGLGLALVSEIAHLHGGGTAVVNRKEGGAEATIWVPISDAL
ncbi:MAG: two-component system sensor histidine kinase CreC [Opitutus sp.]